MNRYTPCLDCEIGLHDSHVWVFLSFYFCKTNDKIIDLVTVRHTLQSSTSTAYFKYKIILCLPPYLKQKLLFRVQQTKLNL